MNERLSASDMSSLLAERGPIHVHVGATIVVDGEPPAFAELVEHVDASTGADPAVSPEDHGAGTARARATRCGPTTRASTSSATCAASALPRPGGMGELRELVGRVMSEPLDLTRPLWQLYLIEGLEDGRHAYISKTHHALVDGVAAVDVGTIILDASPEGTEMEITEERWEPDEPSPELLFVRDASDRIRSPAARGPQGGARRR